jgi:hypothetical protein
MDSDDIGTHSIRKGSSTNCASGSTACPSSTAIHLRAGWSLGGVQNTYESVSDMYVGRTASELPLDSYKQIRNSSATLDTISHNMIGYIELLHHNI